MSTRSFAPVLAAVLIVASGLPAPSPTSARNLSAALRGGLAALARGDRPIDSSIASRWHAGTPEVAVSIEVADAADPLLRARLAGAGVMTRGSWRTTVEGYVAPGRLWALAGVRGVRSVTPIRRPFEASFVGPGPAIHGATAWQDLGISGAGIKVGILDGGFDGFTGLLGNELPATVQARCYAQIGQASSTFADCVTPGVHHGTAVAETILDMAPGVSLYVSNADSRADVADAIRWMTGAGVRVINFSQGALLEGMGDGTSPYPNSFYALVDLAVSGGALFVAAAGNAAETTWLGPPADPDGNGWIDFASGDESDALDLQAGDSMTLGIRWVDPASDYDLSIWQGPTKVAEAADSQAQTRDPLEALDFTAPSSGTYSLRVWHRSGPAAASIRLMVLTSANTALRYRTSADSLPAPADSRNPGLLTVGAVNYRATSAVEPYSSQGPTLDGRTKPDLAAVDCAPTTVAPMFCGTSESAPFVTGAAALLLEANPTWTPAQLATYLRSNATPIGATIPNNATGFGLLALGRLATPEPASLAFIEPAASGTAGAALLGQPVIEILDSSGGPVTSGPGASLPVTLSLATNPAGGTLSCAGGLTAVAAGGFARFSGCSIDRPGSGYVVHADAPGVTGMTGAPFVVNAPGTAPALTLSVSPTTVAYGSAIALRGEAALPAGANVAIVAETEMGGRFSELGTTATDATGLATWTAKPRIGTNYRIRTVASDSGIVEVSAPLHVTVKATATLVSSVASGRTIRLTTRLTLTTRIRPIGTDVARGRVRVDALLRTRSGWTRRRTVYANADPAGRARFSLFLPATGSWWIRSRAERTATNGASAWTSGVRYTVRR